MSRSDKDRKRRSDDFSDIRPHGASKRREMKGHRHSQRQRLRDFVGNISGEDGRTANESYDDVVDKMEDTQ